MHARHAVGAVQPSVEQPSAVACTEAVVGTAGWVAVAVGVTAARPRSTARRHLQARWPRLTSSSRVQARNSTACRVRPTSHTHIAAMRRSRG